MANIGGDVKDLCLYTNNFHREIEEEHKIKQGIEMIGAGVLVGIIIYAFELVKVI